MVIPRNHDFAIFMSLVTSCITPSRADAATRQYMCLSSYLHNPVKANPVIGIGSLSKLHGKVVFYFAYKESAPLHGPFCCCVMLQVSPDAWQCHKSLLNLLVAELQAAQSFTGILVVTRT